MQFGGSVKGSTRPRKRSARLSWTLMSPLSRCHPDTTASSARVRQEVQGTLGSSVLTAVSAANSLYGNVSTVFDFTCYSMLMTSCALLDSQQQGGCRQTLRTFVSVFMWAFWTQLPGEPMVSIVLVGR